MNDQNRSNGNKPTNLDTNSRIERLQDMDIPELSQAILTFATNNNLDTNRIQLAINLASDLHQNDIRDSDKGASKPYIIHPLRNTLRLIYLGVMLEDLLIASILHDTVEDHVWEMYNMADAQGMVVMAREQYARPASKSGPGPGLEPEASRSETIDESNCHSNYEDKNNATKFDRYENETFARYVAYMYITTRFSKEASRIVEGMSNPIPQSKPFDLSSLRSPPPSVEDRNKRYAEHVETATKDPMVFACKVSDFIDNAVGMVRGLDLNSDLNSKQDQIRDQYQNNEANPIKKSLNPYDNSNDNIALRRRNRRAAKYLPVVQILDRRLELGVREGNLPFSTEGVEAVKRELMLGKVGLQWIVDQADGL